jgi:energy-coupling factor transport system ATP-binding protein
MPIQVSHLTHTYLPGSPFSATAIHDITLTIEDGEFIGVLGHTGSGKTTFVQHLNGLLKPSEGRVVVDGVDITQKGVSLLAVRKKVGLVFQYPEYQLFEETVAKDVAFGPKNMGLTKGEIDERVRWAIAQVGLDYDAVAASSPFELSGGQMRRVAIAGVLAMQPKVLILDEPTAGLDPRGRRAILDMIRRLHAENRMTVIMVSHNMDDIATLATRLVVMGKGELRMTGTPREVFKRRDELRAIGLGVPQGAELCHRLRERGFAIPEGLYLLDEVRDAILALAGKGVPAAAEGDSQPIAAMVAQALATPGPDAPEGAPPADAVASPAEGGRG